VKQAKRGRASAHAHQAAQKSNLSTPKVVASSGAGRGAGSGPTVNNDNATGKVGELPKEEASTKVSTEKQPEPMTELPKSDAPKPEGPKEVARVMPVVKAPAFAKPDPKPEPKAPVFTEAAPAMAIDREPQPAIPEDLRADALDKTCVVRFTVGPDGSTIRVQIAQSSGNNELDRAALDAARQWKFKPATRDGEPVESQVNLHIEFQVS